ncbi:unnamed protein product [Chrysoparadoxa australica]
MRPLTDEETAVLFEKLSSYMGENVGLLINRQDKHCFRLHKDRVYYVSEKLLRQSTNMEREALISIGTCFGKFSKSRKFRLVITCLDYLAQYAKHKVVWVKPSAEMSFLYGNHVVKSGLARITDGTPQYAGVVVYSMSDIPLGFGVAAQPTEYCRDLEPHASVVLHQADVGEYLRDEGELLVAH